MELAEARGGLVGQSTRHGVMRHQSCVLAPYVYNYIYGSYRLSSPISPIPRGCALNMKTFSASSLDAVEGRRGRRTTPSFLVRAPASRIRPGRCADALRSDLISPPVVRLPHSRISSLLYPLNQAACVLAEGQ